MGNRRYLQKLLESGRRGVQEMAVLDEPGITQLMGDVARGYESIACHENLSDEDL
jgi:hypothetical protein